MLITNDKNRTNMNGLVSAYSISAVYEVVKNSQHSQRIYRKLRPFEWQHCRPVITLRHNVACKCKNTLITYTIKKKEDELEISLLISIRKHSHIYCNYEPVNKRGSIIKTINSLSSISGVTRNFVSGGGVQQIQLRTERRGIWGR